MTGTQTFHVKEYELSCSAVPSAKGGFEPALVICRQAWPKRPRTIAVDRGPHASADSAIESAHAQGIEWVANYG
jgi:hypothetical protein